MMLAPTLTLSVFAMFSSQAKLAERALADVAVIEVPRSVKEMYKGVRDDQQGRLVFAFSSEYFWASFGSGTAYKQQLFVSIMAPDASDAEYDAYPKRYDVSYDNRKTVRTTSVGSGTLRIVEGVYVQNSLKEPSHTFFYVDRVRRLQIAWHAVASEIDVATGTDITTRMAASFRILRDPMAQFAEMRDRPRKEAEDHARKRALAMETLEREGYGPLEPGKPVLKNDVYVEWMTDPEPRFQLLLPLGRVRIAPNVTPATRPRPVAPRNADGTRRSLAGSVGWHDFMDGEWVFSNGDNAYLPFRGVARTLSERSDPAFVSFYYSATVRVEEELGDERLTNLGWFFDSLPEVRRLWQAGKLVSGGTPASD
jgi:hypothetical protein